MLDDGMMVDANRLEMMNGDSRAETEEATDKKHITTKRKRKIPLFLSPLSLSLSLSLSFLSLSSSSIFP